VGPTAGLDGRKISSPTGFDPGPSSPLSVAIPTELPGPHYIYIYIYVYIYIHTHTHIHTHSVFVRLDGKLYNMDGAYIKRGWDVLLLQLVL